MTIPLGSQDSAQTPSWFTSFKFSKWRIERKTITDWVVWQHRAVFPVTELMPFVLKKIQALVPQSSKPKAEKTETKGEKREEWRMKGRRRIRGETEGGNGWAARVAEIDAYSVWDDWSHPTTENLTPSQRQEGVSPARVTPSSWCHKESCTSRITAHSPSSVNN